MRPAMPPQTHQQTLDIALIGSGARGMAWLATLLTPEAAALGLRLAGVCDLNPATGDEPLLALASGVCMTGHDLTATLARQPRIVIDATSSVTRLAVMRTAMQSGAHVLCDPPLALDDATALTLIGAAKRWPGRLAVAYLSRRRAGLSQMRDLVALKQLGRPLALDVDLPLGEDAGLQALLRGPMVDAFDAGRAILGADGATVSCVGPPCRAVFEMASAARLTIAMRRGPEHWRLEMEGGVVTCGDMGPAILQGGAVLDGPLQAEGQLGALTDFVEAVRTGRVPHCGPRSAASSLAMALAAHASALRGGRIETVLHLGLMGDASGSPAPSTPRAGANLIMGAP